jgi:hypothetical protein
MKAARFLLPVYCGLMSYLVLVLFFGPNGIVSFDGLQGEKNAIESNLITLKQYNETLNGKIEALKGSRDELIAESQKMGYYPPDSRILRFKDYDSRGTFYNAGSIFRAAARKPVPEWALRVLASSIACVVFIAIGRKPGRSKEKKTDR